MTDTLRLHCTIVRVISCAGRFFRNILVKTGKWQGKTEDDELPPRHAYAIIRDIDVMASADSRIKYVLLVEQLHDQRPWPLEGKARTRQVNPPNGFEGEPNGTATIFSVVRVISAIFDGMPPTLRMVADSLSTRGRAAFAQRYRIIGEAGRQPIEDAANLLAILAGTSSLDPKQRNLAFETLADTFMPPAYTALTSLALATPSSLCRLHVGELCSFVTWLKTPEIMALLPTRAAEIASVAWCMSLAVCAVEKPLKPHGKTQNSLGKALNNMYMSGSTVFTLEDAGLVPQWTIDMGAIIALENGEYTTARQVELEAFAAKTLKSADFVAAITTPGGMGGPGAAALYGKRVPPLISLLTSEEAGKCVWYFAPTPGHAAALAAAGLDAFSVHDVQAKRTFQGRLLGQPTALCFLFAHGFTLMQFRHIIAGCPPAMAIIMAGDKLAWGGDASSLFRDVCTSISSGDLHGSRGKIERLTSVEPHWSHPLYNWPAASTDTPCIECVEHAPPSACSIPLVASHAWTQTKDWCNIGKWAMMPDFGWIGQCQMPPEPTHVWDRCAVANIQDGYDFGLNHTFCCGIDGISPAVHPDFQPIWAGAPVRIVARASPHFLADEIAVFAPTDGTLPSLQDIRAAASLARRKLYFVTPGGTKLPLLDAEKKHLRRPKSRLCQAITEANAVVRAPVHIDAQPQTLPIPCKLHFFGAMELATKRQLPHLSAGACITQLQVQLGFQAMRMQPNAEVQQPMQMVASAGVIGLPRPFQVVSGTLASAMTQHEIDLHVWARLTIGSFVLPELVKDANIEHLASIFGGPHRTYHDRENVAIHMICLAVKGRADFEAWYILHEELLFYNRLMTLHPDADTLLSLVHSSERATLASNMHQAIAQKHARSIQEYLARHITALPATNPIENDETDDFAFYNTVIQIRKRIVALMLQQ